MKFYSEIKHFTSVSLNILSFIHRYDLILGWFVNWQHGSPLRSARTGNRTVEWKRKNTVSVTHKIWSCRLTTVTRWDLKIRLATEAVRSKNSEKDGEKFGEGERNIKSHGGRECQLAGEPETVTGDWEWTSRDWEHGRVSPQIPPSHQRLYQWDACGRSCQHTPPLLDWEFFYSIWLDANEKHLKKWFYEALRAFNSTGELQMPETNASS